MKHLPTPIATVLDDDVDESRINAMWNGVDVAIARKGASRGPAALLAAGFAVAAAIILGVVLSRPVSDSSLALEDGSAPVISEVSPGEPARTLRFAEHSSITLSPGTRIEPIANNASEFSLVLPQGHADFDITPGGPRRWRIDCGPLNVEVLGTAFTIDRSATRIRVAVARGLVMVTGEDEAAAFGTRKLRQGESAEVRLDQPPESAPIAIRAPPAEDVLEAPPQRLLPPSTPARVESWRALAEHGDHASAYEVLSPRGIEQRSERANVRELMLLADVARLSGHPADAVRPLERLLAMYPRDPEAPLAAIILGRLERARGNHGRAAEVLGRAIELGVPSALSHDIRAERVIELERAGDRERARAEARAYLDAYPQGAHADDMRIWLEAH